MVTLMLRFSVATDRHGELKAFLARARPYYEQPGGIHVRLLENLAGPGDFVEIVEYQDEETYRRDQVRVETDPGMKALLAEWRTFHVGGLVVEAYRDTPLPA